MAASLGIASLPAWAASQNEVVITRNFDGTSSFEGSADTGDPTDPPTSAPTPHTPGFDSGGNNGVVRTFDLFGVRVDWDVNEEAATNVILEVTLSVQDGGEGDVSWQPDKSGLFAGCSDQSTISADGLTLTCYVGDQPEGSHGTILPGAKLLAGLDNSLIDVGVKMITDQDTTGITDQIDVPFTVSEAPSADWYKNVPIITLEPVTVGSESGYVAMFPLSLRDDYAAESQAKGSGPIDASTPITFYDHAWDLADGTRLATADEITAAQIAGYDIYGSPCGAYDAQNAGAYPVTAGTWSPCADEGSPNGYPVWSTSISGYDTTPPATNADGSNNTNGTIISGQIVLWLPEASVQVDLDSEDGAEYFNTISSDTPDVDVSGPNPAPIAIPGTSGPTDEKATANNTNRFAITSPSGGGGGTTGDLTYFTHHTYFQSQVYKREFESRPGAVRTYGFPIRPTTPADPFALWSGNGEVSRGTPVNMTLRLNTYTSTQKVSTISGCMRWDPEQIFLKPMGPIPTEYNGQPGGTFVQENPASGFFEDVIYGQSNGSLYDGPYRPNGLLPYGPEELAAAGITIEYGYETGATTYSDNVAQNSLECNDAADRVWLGSDDLGAFEARKDEFGRYKFDMVRVIVDQHKWYKLDPTIGNLFFGPHANSGLRLSLQGIVGTDLDINFDGKSLYVHSSRADGEWVDGRPTTTGCLSVQDTNDYRLVTDPPPPTTTGWCNLAYSVSNENANPTDWTSLDRENFSWVTGDPDAKLPDRVWDSDTDRVTIVQVRPGITKTNIDGNFDIKNNGEYVIFDLDVSAVGSEREALYDVTLTDPMPNGYTLDQILVQPTTPGSSCSIDTEADTLNCRFSEEDPNADTGDLPEGLPGGWTDTLRIRVKVESAIANQNTYRPIDNLATINSSGLGAWDPETNTWLAGADLAVVAQFDEDNARSYMPLGSDEGAIVKAVNGDPCAITPDPERFPIEMWQERCADIELDVDPANGTTVDADGNMTFTLSYENTGNTLLRNMRIVDVLPFNGDGANEPGSNSAEDGADPSTVGDARSPASDFDGRLGLVDVTGDVSEYWTTSADPTIISRDPDLAIKEIIWCDADGNIANLDQMNTDAQGACPATGYDVTAVFIAMGNVIPETTKTAQLVLDTEEASCEDLWTNTFGARVNEIRLPIRSNDVSIMTKCDYDLALQKLVAPDWTYPDGWATPDESIVKFTIEVINQDDPVEDFKVTDYVDTSIWEFIATENPDGTTTAGALGSLGTGPELPYTWDATDPEKPVVSVDGKLGAGESVIIPVYLRVAAIGPAMDNFAEISYFDNDGDPTNGDSDTPKPGQEDLGPLTDTDSTPDDENNEPGDDIMIDNEINETPETGDEDDQDIAKVQWFDLALRKTLAKDQASTIYVNDNVTFDIEVFNQGNIQARDLVIVDYFPPELELNDPDWTALEDGKVTTALDGVVLEPQTSIVVPITFKVLKAGDLNNYAEIASTNPTDEDGNTITDEEGNPVPDIDSIPDTENNEPDDDIMIDDEINKNPETGDEDDQDIAPVKTNEKFDLALRKKLAPSQDKTVYIGDKVTFNIEVFNQGTVDARDIQLVDYLPPQLELADPDWAPLEENKVIIDLPGVVLKPGTSVVVPITVKVLEAGDLDNYAEISKARPTDEDGDTITDDDGNPIKDVDSDPDTENGDELIDDEINKTPETGDEDDNDIASITTKTPPPPPSPKPTPHPQTRITVTTLASTGAMAGAGVILLVGAAIVGGTALLAKRRSNDE